MRILPALAALLCFSSLISVQAQTIRSRDHMRNARYGEILIVKGGPFNFIGSVYNTLGLNDCPEAQWKALDPEKLKQQYKARAVLLNGPRYFLMDKNSIANPGGVSTFGGLQARHLADVQLSLFTFLRGKSKPYTENAVKRSTEYVFLRNRPVYTLVSPAGETYVMQSYALIVDPTLTMANLAGLGSKLKMPAGWKYNVLTPKSDLILRATGTAYVLQDELQNSYQRVGKNAPKP